MANKRVVLHDYFAVPDGGGRLALTLARNLDADLVHGFRKPEHPYFTGDTPGPREKTLASGNLPFPLLQLGLIQAFSRKTAFLSRYEVCVFSGNYSVLGAHQAGSARTVYYCHTPPRFLFEELELFTRMVPKWLRPAMRSYLAGYRGRYLRSVDAMDVVVANSQTVSRRIAQNLNLNAVVVHPPCDTSSFSWCEQGDFYLSTGRLDRLKRIDTIIASFRAMPDKKLAIVSTGPEEGRIRSLCEGARNIRFLGRVSDAELKALVGSCIATIYIPTDEDFGMSPVESMAAGKPVIGVREGGLLETVIEAETGILISPGAPADELIQAVCDMTPDRALSMRKACENRAREFDVAVFMNKMRGIIDG
ncbi:glycosyl transferase [Oceanidesulfovibrio indonesiensis]|uniref:Glycosyl transferase n=1 Tax=Oceanidesulfovibrio indonesiensis TaxID=54767 RepID=A0A7M3ME63_9BACT|nr:glycosyltransferase [Oceanidesulfovibrio indonesiensis]TVM17106.1 glycosyl transferase [Oceanidesulfovibrio indonesiensis]